MRCVHCGVPLRPTRGDSGLHVHVTKLQRCQDPEVPYGHMGHPAMPCPSGEINPCLGFREEKCEHVR